MGVGEGGGGGGGGMKGAGIAHLITANQPCCSY